MPDWRQEAAQAVDKELAHTREAPEWVQLGRLRPLSESGWYAVDLRNRRQTPDNLDQACVAGQKGPHLGLSVPVETVRFADGILRVRITGSIPEECDRAWTLSLSLRVLLERLASGLRAIEEAPLADRLAAGRLDDVPRTAPTPTGLLGAQPDAYRACLTPGLRAVWGPPGSGKTRVLASAIEDLVEEGNRVLLVSTANVAVDNALVEIVRRLRPVAGTVVRAGTPHLAELAANDDVQLHKLASRAASQVDQERLAVQEQLAGFDRAARRFAELDGLLEVYDHDRHLQIDQRVENAARIASLEGQLPELAEQHNGAKRALAAAGASVEQADAEWQRTADQRSLLAHARELTSQLRHREQAFADLNLRVAAGRKSLQWRTGWKWRERRELRKAEKQLSRLAAELPVQRQQLHARIADCLRGVSPLTENDVHRMQEARAGAQRQMTAAVRAERTVSERISAIHGELTDRTNAGVPSDQDREWHTWCVRQNLPDQYRQWEELRNLVRKQERARGRLEKQLPELADRARRLRRDAEGEIVSSARVVATTLARARAQRTIAKQGFDVVLVDEAGAARLAEVLLAVSQATRTAVLFGDFLQLPPIMSPNELKRDPLVAKWLVADVFAHCGIWRPEDAQRHNGCVVLSHQFRFGPTLRELANSVIYRVLEDGYDLVDSPPPEDTEIVLIDTSTVPDLATVSRRSVVAGWWPIGALLSRVLAEAYVPRGETVGVVTPFGAQVEASLAAVRDSSSLLPVDVGTVHGFQGREFDVVVFDLVEDNNGWMRQAKVDGNSFENEGARLFGVGITRVKRRLFVIARQDALVAANPKTVLGAFARLLREGRVTVCPAHVLLGLGEPERTPSSAVEIELAEVLGQFVQVTEITDELAFRDALATHIDSATESIWLWSPWIGNRSEKVLPHIGAAAERDVTVRAILRPDNDQIMRKDSAQHWLRALRDCNATIVRSDVEHRKIVVIDDETVVLGSYNPLSQSRSREIMVTCRGREFAKRMLSELGADQLRSMPHCDRCQVDYELKRSMDKRINAPEFWRCPGCNDRKSLTPSTTGKRRNQRA